MALMAWPALCWALQGSGTQADPYQVTNLADLQQVAAAVNGGNSYAGQYLALTADIDGQGATLSPIGRLTSAPFSGTFSGGGHSISHIGISDSSACTGLFGYATATSTISGVALKQVTVTGSGNYTGGLVAATLGTVTGCSVSGTVTGAATTGGVVGEAYGATVTLSHFSGKLLAGTTGGGVAGRVVLGTVDACYNVGLLRAQGTEAVLGGVVGSLAGTVSNCYNTGVVANPSSRSTGGIVGQVNKAVNGQGASVESTVSSCYTAGYLEAETYQYDKASECREVIGTIAAGATPTLSNLYFDAQMCDKTSTRYRALTSALTGTSLAGFDAAKWVFAQGFYPRLKGIDQGDDALLSASVLQLDEGFPDVSRRVSNDITLHLLGSTSLASTSHCGTVEGNVYKLNGTFGTDTLVLQGADGATRAYVMQFTPRFLDGVGNAQSPFLIKTKADLIRLSQVTTELKQAYPDTYFQLANDIDLQLDTAFVGIAANNSDVTVHFAGHLDGAGHAIHRMKLDAVEWEVVPTATTMGKPAAFTSHSYKGLIGRLDAEGSVSNLTIASDCELDFWAYSGAVVGYNYGTVTGCTNEAAVRGYSVTIGGLVGLNQAGATVSRCLNVGSVTTGYRSAGGISGSTYGTVSECANVGDVSGRVLSNFVAASRIGNCGGISGSTSTGAVVTNCLNAGTVRTRGAAGGIVGDLTGTMRSCLNYGTLLTTDGPTTGGVAGTMTSGTFANVYFDAQVTGLKGVAGASKQGVVPSLTRTLTSGEALSGLGSSLWQFTAGSYPVLKRFATQLHDAASIIVTMDDADVASHIGHNAALSAGATWALRRGTDFSINNSTLQVPGKVTTAVADTLVATLGNLSKPIALQAVPSLALQGSGTEADPYLIASAADWNEAARYMTDMAETYEGKWLRITRDIAFDSTTTVIPLGSDGHTSFDGTLLGDGHSITVANLQGTGLAITLGEASRVENLTLKGTLTATDSRAGALAVNGLGTLSHITNRMTVTGMKNSSSNGGLVAVAGGNSRMDSCINLADVTATSGYSGGMAGQALSGARFTGCENHGAVSGRNAGGITGNAAGIRLDGCLNQGTINGTDYAAGLVGYVAGTDTLRVRTSHNSGTVTAASSAGGIVGGQTESVSATRPVIDLRNCTNHGSIKTTAAATSGSLTATGGIAGILSPGSRVFSCHNTGAVTALKSSNVGGIAGQVIGGGDIVSLSRCSNGGPITATTGKDAGGIVGSLGDFSNVSLCSNTGAVSASLISGGIVASVGGADVTLSQCWNAGAISTQRNGAAGLVGYCGYRASVSDCFNVGTITAGTGFAGGLGAQVGMLFERCYNRGTVTAPKSAGGLVGIVSRIYAKADCLALLDCYNAGRVVATTEGALWGNVMGNGKYFDATCTASGTSYVTDWGVSLTDTIGTPTTIAALAADDFILPMAIGLDTCASARAYAAAVVLQDSDTYNMVTRDCHLGLPEGVTWTSSNPQLVTIDGGVARLAKNAEGTVVLTARCGPFTADWPLTVKSTSGIADVQHLVPILATDYYNLNGAKVTHPQPGQLLIRVTRYADGSTRSQVITKTVRSSPK